MLPCVLLTLVPYYCFKSLPSIDMRPIQILDLLVPHFTRVAYSGLHGSRQYELSLASTLQASHAGYVINIKRLGSYARIESLNYFPV